jgi:hypothetical protein
MNFRIVKGYEDDFFIIVVAMKTQYALPNFHKEKHMGALR